VYLYFRNRCHGPSRGIGAAVAERLAEDGFTVVINYSGDASGDAAPAEALAHQILRQADRNRS
jgi:3-oxoacyl-[acyl-carrier protein] reductase